MRNLLEDDEAIQGMQYLNRATLLIHETKNPELILYFKLCQARILDASRKFLEAAVKYRIPHLPPSRPLSQPIPYVSPESLLGQDLREAYHRRRLLRTNGRRSRAPKMSLRSNNLRSPRPRRPTTFPYPRHTV